MTKTPIWEGTRWRLRVQIDGKMHYFTSTKAGKAGKIEVNRKYRQFLDGTTPDRQKVNDVYALFLENYETKNGETPTLKKHKDFGRLYILPVIGSNRACMLTVNDFQQIINKAKPQGRTAKNGQLSHKTLSNLRETCSAFIRYLVEHYYIDPPRASLYIPANAPEGERDTLQPDEVKRLFEYSDNFYINCFRLMACTGLRCGEVYGIEKKNIDLDTGLIKITQSINRQGKITKGKNKNARRSFVLSQFALDVVKEQIDKTEHLNSKWLFPNEHGGMIYPNTAYKNWVKIAKEKNLSGSPYCLRHTFISFMKNDVNITALKRICGHSPDFDTLGVYGHDVEGEMQITACTIDKTLREKIG